MARFRRMDVLQAMMASGLVPVFYHKDLETARNVARAVAGGGVRVLEFTNRGDFAFQIFSDLIQWCEAEIPELILGVGSVIDPGTAALYINSGANFIVGPVLNAEVARTCNRRKIPYLPGCGSASEVSQAEEYGVEICKIFPGKEVGGPAFVKNILAPMPWTLIMPTGGVETTRESIEAWFKAGVACVGVGSNLMAKELIAAGDFAAISPKDGRRHQLDRRGAGPFGIRGGRARRPPSDRHGRRKGDRPVVQRYLRVEGHGRGIVVLPLLVGGRTDRGDEGNRVAKAAHRHPGHQFRAGREHPQGERG